MDIRALPIRITKEEAIEIAKSGKILYLVS